MQYTAIVQQLQVGRRFRRRSILLMSSLFMLLNAAFARAAEMNVETLQAMPLQIIAQPNGDEFRQRDRKDIERIVGFVTGQSVPDAKTFDPEAIREDGALWADYLSRPHPSVQTIRRYFEAAAQEFGVPMELLAAIGQVESNWTQIGPSIDQGWGVMHLVQNNYVDTLGEAAALLGVDAQRLKDDARQNIRAAAALLASYAGTDAKNFTRIEDWFEAAKRFSALYDDELRDMQAVRYFDTLKNGSQSLTLWDEQIMLPANPAVDLTQRPDAKDSENLLRSTDYGPALTNLTTCNYTSGRTSTLDTWVNHWVGTGTYAGAISWFHNCSADASAHFVIRSSDGEITQVVRVANTAWHAGATGYNNNSRSIGVEHEATAANPGLWNSTPMLQASANMARYFADLHGIPKTRSLPGIRGHNEMPGTSTACPGSLPWDTWMGYLNSGLCGALSGTLAAGTYNLSCDIYVNAGQTLHIMPGVTVNYNSHSFTVNGQLVWGP